MNYKTVVRLLSFALLALAGSAFADESISSVTVGSGTVLGGEAAEGIVTLASPAPVGGWKVSLSSKYTSMQVPATVTVVAGYKEAGFLVNIDPNTRYYVNTVTAKDANSTKSGSVKVEAPDPVIQIHRGASNMAYDPVHELLLAVPGGAQEVRPPLIPDMNLPPVADGLLVINPSTGDVAKTIDLPAPALNVAISADNSHIFASCNNGTVCILDADTYAIKATATVPGGNPINLMAVPGTSESFVVCNGATTYIFDGAVQRPNSANLGTIQAVSEDGLYIVGGDWQVSNSNYNVAAINSKGFYNQKTGYGPVTPDLTYAYNHPVNGSGVIMNPDSGAYEATLPFISSPNRRVTGMPNNVDVVSLSWYPDTAQVTDMETRTSLGTLALPDTDGGLGLVYYAGHHRIAYFTFGFITDYQIVIVTNLLFP